MKPNIQFRAKVQTIRNMDGTPAFERVKVPNLNNSHCDMTAFRQHPTFGQFANSDLFPSVLRRALKAIGVDDYLRLDRIPEGVTVDTSGFLALVRISL